MIPVFKAVFAGKKNASLTVVPLAPFWWRLYFFWGGAIIKSIQISNKNKSKNAHAGDFTLENEHFEHNSRRFRKWFSFSKAWFLGCTTSMTICRSVNHNPMALLRRNTLPETNDSVRSTGCAIPKRNLDHTCIMKTNPNLIGVYIPHYNHIPSIFIFKVINIAIFILSPRDFCWGKPTEIKKTTGCPLSHSLTKLVTRLGPLPDKLVTYGCFLKWWYPKMDGF